MAAAYGLKTTKTEKEQHFHSHCLWLTDISI
jgi:hypothetical protein